MGLSDDQRAMLRLLAQREQGYEDIAALMGLSVEEVRVRVKEALDQLEAEGKEAPVPPPPAPEPAPPQPEVPAEPEPPAPEPAPAPPAAEPQPPAPEPPEEAAPLPPPPPPKAEPAAAGTAPPPRGGRPRLGLPRDPGARLAILAGTLAVIALAVVLIVSGGGGDGSSTTSSGTSGTSGGEAAENTSASGSANELTKAELKPVAGGEGSGEAVFGRYKEKVALQVIANGLQPTTKGNAYTVWIARSPKKMLPLASAKANNKGQIRAEFEVPTEVLGYLANETFRNIVISRTSTPLLEAALTKATKEEKPPIYTGTHVLEGEITGPIVGAAKEEEAEKKE